MRGWGRIARRLRERIPEGNCSDVFGSSSPKRRCSAERNLRGRTWSLKRPRRWLTFSSPPQHLEDSFALFDALREGDEAIAVDAEEEAEGEDGGAAGGEIDADGELGAHADEDEHHGELGGEEGAAGDGGGADLEEEAADEEEDADGEEGHFIGEGNLVADAAVEGGDGEGEAGEEGAE